MFQEGNNSFIAQNGLSSLAQSGAQVTEDPLAKLLREYRDAKYRFDNACQSAAKAIQERDAATNALEQISQAVEKAVASGRYDPTMPQVVCEAPPTPNGQFRR